MAKHWLRQDYGFMRDSWYGQPYEILNGMPKGTASVQILAELQKRKIIQHNKPKEDLIAKLNTTLEAIQKNYKLAGGEGDYFEKLFNAINSGYGAFQDKQPKPVPPKYLEQYEQDVLNFLSLANGGRVPQSLQKQLGDISNRILVDPNFYAYRERKSKFCEDIATWILSLAGFNSTTIGNMVSEWGGQQLITDSFAYLSQGGNVRRRNTAGDIKMSMRFTNAESKKQNIDLLEYLKQRYPATKDTVQFGKNNWIEMSVGEMDVKGFNNMLEETSHSLNRKITGKISDNFLDSVEQSLKIQVKSGGNQSLINKGRGVGKEELLGWSIYLSTLDTFYENYSYHPKVSGGSSASLAAYVNFVFSTNLPSTGLGENDLYFSKYGFSTLDKQMEAGGFYYELEPVVNSIYLLNATSKYTISQKSI